MTKNDVLNKAFNNIKTIENYGIIQSINPNLEVLSYAEKYFLSSDKDKDKDKEYGIIYTCGNANELIVKSHLDLLVKSKYITSYARAYYNENEEFIVDEHGMDKYPAEDFLMKALYGEPMFIYYYNPRASKIKYLKDVRQLLDLKSATEKRGILDTSDIEYCVQQYMEQPKLMEHFQRVYAPIIPSSFDAMLLIDFLFYIKTKHSNDYNYFVEGIDELRQSEEEHINMKHKDVKIEVNKKIGNITFYRGYDRLGSISINSSEIGKKLLYCFDNNITGPVSPIEVHNSLPGNNTTSMISARKSFNDALDKFNKKDDTEFNIRELFYVGKDGFIHLNYKKV